DMLSCAPLEVPPDRRRQRGSGEPNRPTAEERTSTARNDPGRAERGTRLADDRTERLRRVRRPRQLDLIARGRDVWICEAPDSSAEEAEPDDNQPNPD